MQKVLIVSERSNIFYSKYIENFIKAALKLNWEPILLTGDDYKIAALSKIKQIDSPQFRYFSKSLDENRYLEIFKIVRSEKIDHIHLVRLFDPQRMFLALKTDIESMCFKFSFTFYGLSQNLRNPIQQKYFDELVKLDCIDKFSIVSINPQEAIKFIKIQNLFETSKLLIWHDPIFDKQSNFNFSKVDCRNDLDIDSNKKVVLYIGGFDYSKGPDIYCKMAQSLFEEEKLLFIMAGDMKRSSFEFNKANYSNESIMFDDRYLNEEIIAKYLISADLVVLPYRKFYENGTSGVLVQACMAKTPVLVPNITPFKETIETEDIGFSFECESEISLMQEIQSFFNRSQKFSGFDSYLSKIEGWDYRVKQLLS